MFKSEQSMRTSLHMAEIAIRIEQQQAAETSLDDSSAWKDELLVLSFDGGGVRGYASLLLLQKLMEEIRRVEESLGYTESFGITHESERKEGERFLPCHYFDYMFGTSTGGLNAIMLGRLRMNVDECLQRYPQMCQNIFGKPRRSLKGLWRARYNAKYLRKEIETIVKSKTPQSEHHNMESKWRMFPSPTDLCRTACLSSRIQEREIKAELFRTYRQGSKPRPNDPILDSGPASNYTICKVARATSAAPTYFKETKIGRKSYIDGGVKSNNPSPIAITSLFKYHDRLPSFLVSIGTGKPVGATGEATQHPIQHSPRSDYHDEGESLGDDASTDSDDDGDNDDEEQQSPGKLRKFWKGFRSAVRLHSVRRVFKRNKRLFHTFLQELTETQGQHFTAKDRMKQERRNSKHRKENYIRLNVSSKVGRVRLDEWSDKNRDLMVQEVEDFTERRRENIRRCAEHLVDVRQRRMNNCYRWERWAYAKLFRCNQEKCSDTLSSTSEMVNHLKKKHRMTPPDGVDASRNWAFVNATLVSPEIPGGPW